MQNNQLIKFPHVIIHINHKAELNLESNQKQRQMKVDDSIKDHQYQH